MLFDSFQARVSLRVWTQFLAPDDSNVVGVGFGVGLREDRIDLQRPVVLRLYVQRKRKRASRAVRRPKSEIDSTVKIDLLETTEQLFLPSRKRAHRDLHGRTVQGAIIEIPTDVFQLGNVVSSGALASVVGNSSIVTAGTIVRWRQVLSPNVLRWGIVTVAHGFEPAIDPLTTKDTRIIHSLDGSQFEGKRLIQFRPPLRGFDTVLIAVQPGDLLHAGLIPSESAPAISPMTYDQIGVMGGGVGVSYQQARHIGFHLIGNVAPLNVRGVGTVDRMVHVRSFAEQAFIDTTSGSVYAIADPESKQLIPAAIQIGADSDTQYRDGYAQCLHDLLHHLALELHRRLAPNADGLVAQKLELVQWF